MTLLKLDLTRLVLRSGPKVKIGSKMVPMIFTGHIMKVYGEIGPTFFFEISKCDYTNTVPIRKMTT